MTKQPLIILFLLISLFSFAQEEVEKVTLEGFILDCDSIPIESAYLISYKTLRAYATDENGYFNIQVFPDDSLKVHHLAFEPQILKPGDKSASKHIMEFSDNEIEAVTVKYKNLEMIYFEKNMATIRRQLAKMGNSHYANGSRGNPYNPHDQYTNTTGINILELIRLFKK